MRAIVEALRHCRETAESCVIATIIRVEGSAYRREGARCLIHADGRIVGILSGGCLEAELKEQAHHVFVDGESRRVHYDLRATSEEEPWGLGTGCDGAVTVWMELFDPISHPAAAAAILADGEARLSAPSAYWSLTVVGAEDDSEYAAGDRWQLPVATEESGPIAWESGSDGGRRPTACAASRKAVEQARESQPLPRMRSQSSAGLLLDTLALPQGGRGLCTGWMRGGLVEVFAELVRPVPRLVVLGSGADAELLSQMAAPLGWAVTIADHRIERAAPPGFSTAARHPVPRGDYSSIADLQAPYVVVMTHHLEVDRAAMRQLLPLAAVDYVGLLGSRSRARRIVADVQEDEGFRAEWLAKLHAPVGLDLGGETPEEICLSILAELTAHRHRRDGGPLRASELLDVPQGSAEIR
ncbi:hypothetical protein PA598K_03573 [Paenibacillus sp. 598K]|uniref:XdhC family protein n=1 Tax=Paenibacillus sp. 598K TaxID=1117987 RepID=UPI000FF9C44D|nr:XdhC/CoxI family protein [Paenibacillus sp. 598K]GBF75187.1 hypothetical protein PA598K_03573 [Paenibacillus sp. 598K]